MNRVKELRKAKGYSQEKLASKLNVHQTAISQWETGRTLPDMDVADSMARLFNVTLDYLLGRTDEASPVPSPDATSDEALMFALWGNDNKDITPEMIADVRKFAQFIRETKKDEANDNN